MGDFLLILWHANKLGKSYKNFPIKLERVKIYHISCCQSQASEQQEIFFRNMIRNIRYSITNKLFRDKKSLKAISLLLFFYQKYEGNVIKNWSVNKIASITGINALTVKKRIKTLLENGYAKIDGTSLILLSVVSKHKDRNINISNICYDSIKDVEKSLYAILLCIIQSHKDFCKRTILQAKNARNAKTLRIARSLKRKYGYNENYDERGLSYRRIAIKLGISLKTAFDYVKYAVKKGFVNVQNHFFCIFTPNVNRYPIEGYTFTTDNYAYIVTPNTYTIINNIFNDKKNRD